MYGLEQRQILHNKVISDAGNVSGSNDPNQIKVDAVRDRNNQLSAGAAALGTPLSPEEALEAASSLNRAEKRVARKAETKRMLSQYNKTLADEGYGEEIAGTGYYEEPEVNPFGEAQDDEQTYSRDERINRGLIAQEDLSDIEREQVVDSLSRDRVAPKAALEDALLRVRRAEAAAANPISGLVNRVANPQRMGQLARIQGQLEDHIQYGPTQLGAEASLAAEMAARDRNRSSSEMAQYNQYRAEAEARALLGAMGATGRQGLANVNQISGAPANVAAAMTPAAYTMMPGGGGVQGPAMVPVSQTGVPLAASSPAGVNTPDMSNALNAPVQRSAQEWVAANLPNFREGGRVFGDFNQVDMSGVGATFAQRAGAAGVPQFTGPDARNDVRSIAGLQAAIDSIAGSGRKMYHMAPQEGGGIQKTVVPPAQVGANEVMNSLRYTPEEASQLANKLYQTEIARATTINENPKANYFGGGAYAAGPKDALISTPIPGVSPIASEAIRRHQGINAGGVGVQFNAPEAMDPRGGDAAVARMSPNTKVGDGNNRINAKAALRGLNNPGARSTFIGEVVGGNPNIMDSNVSMRYMPKQIGGKMAKDIPTDRIGSSMVRQEIDRAVAAKRKPNTEGARTNAKRAMLVRERAARDERKRADTVTRIRGKNVSGERDRGSAPSEPGAMGGRDNYGADRSTFEDDEFNRQLVREARARRTR